MYELYPYFTNDGSVGLFSPDADDIYHSTYGALTEALEKFILPANLEKYFQRNNEIKILDICYGIGYNSKSFLNYFLENIFLCKNTSIATLDTNNTNYNDKIYTDNILDYKVGSERPNNSYKIFIKAIDTDKNLVFLSPFFKTGQNFVPNKQDFKNDKIFSMSRNDFGKKIKLRNETNLIFLLKILEKYPEIYKNEEIMQILLNPKYKRYFNRFLAIFCRFFAIKQDKYTLIHVLMAFIHNIYYKYISNSYKNAVKYLKLLDFDFDIKIDDARKVILDDKNKYNLIFLDAFTPAKCPCLWTLDFFKQLYTHLEDDGMIMTYSNSAAIRNAFVNAGFFIGKIYNPSQKKYMGTIATKNNALIENPLSEYDLGLLKTRAGIFYRDKDLTRQNEAIIAAHKLEQENSNLMSSSKYIKEYKKRLNN